MLKKYFYYPLLTLICTFFITPLLAQENTLLDNDGYSFNSLLVVTYQQSIAQDVDPDLLYSLDIEMDKKFDGWDMYLRAEHASNPRNDGVAKKFGGANSDAGTVSHNATQLSEFYVYGTISDKPLASWQLGLMEVSALIDTSEISNDENNQFLSAGLLNNKTIDFPDYSIVARLQHFNAWGELGYRLLIASSHGLDENEGNYHDLLSVTKNNSEFKKGVFLASELLYRHQNYQATLGVWKNTGRHKGEVDSTQWSEKTSGVYIGLDYLSGSMDFNLRYGLKKSAKGNTSSETQVKKYFSASLQAPQNHGVLGAGISLTRYSPTPKSASIGRTSELYYRFPVFESTHLSPALQWTNEDASYEKSYLLPQLRLEIVF